MSTPVLVVVLDVVSEVVVLGLASVEVVPKSVTVVEVLAARVVDAPFQIPQSGQPPSDTAREGSQLRNASLMPPQPAKLNRDPTPITLAARQ
jgi:hypothetical protein